MQLPSLLRLLHLASPSLPIGAYAYSQGLEGAVESGVVFDEHTALDWIAGLLDYSIANVDLPVLLRSFRAWSADDVACVRRWSQHLLGCRESAELQAEEQHLGHALARILDGLGVRAATPWLDDADTTYVGQFALGALAGGASEKAAAAAYAYAWLEHQVSAATRLVPLGQMAAQRILVRSLAAVPAAVEHAEHVPDEEVGFVAPALAMVSARHESQYSRLFRS